MAEATIKRLGEVLEKADALDWRQSLYLPFSEVWDAATTCAVLDPDEGEAADEVPAFAKEHGLGYALGVPAVQDIVVNARMQRPSITADDLVKAFLFYYDHDAFIVFTETS